MNTINDHTLLVVLAKEFAWCYSGDQHGVENCNHSKQSKDTRQEDAVLKRTSSKTSLGSASEAEDDCAVAGAADEAGALAGETKVEDDVDVKMFPGGA